MVLHARAGHTVVRLKGGDPMVFARGAEEWEYLLAQGIEVEIVPGVSAALSVPSLAGIPLTCRRLASSFAVIAGHRENFIRTDWSQYSGIDTLIVLMGVENREYIAESLIREGRRESQPVAFIESGTTPRERVVEATLAAVARGDVDVSPPAIFIIGDVVRMRTRLTKHRFSEVCG